jgi:hypothetical protein
MISV